MPIVQADLTLHLSGGAANADPNASLGGAISNTQLVNSSLHNLFDIVSGDESEAGDAEYRCIYIKNNHATLTWQNVKVWILNQSPSPDTDLEIALAGEGVNGTAETVADESTPPSGEVFSAPASEAEALAVGSIPPGGIQGLWVKRNVGVAAAAYNDDNGQVRLKGETAA